MRIFASTSGARKQLSPPAQNHLTNLCDPKLIDVLVKQKPSLYILHLPVDIT